ncbi:MAG TPA: efflux RND transporter periplasmic adaptor subunit [Clostridia bacterium]|nr:efflux RND transporter periplasmic adaptor subunit [Clostridia bacterium]
MIRRRWRLWVSLLALAAIAWGGWRWYRQATAVSSGQATYLTATVRKGPIEVNVQGTGTVKAAARKELRPGVSGKVIRIGAEKGDKVVSGQLLVELENENLKLQLEKARLDLQEMRRDFEDLVGKRGSLVIRAPFRGRVVTLSATEGQRVAENAVVATLVDDTRLEIQARFTPSQLKDISVGQTAEVFLPDYLSSLSGKVTKVNPLGEPGEGGTVLCPVTIEVQNPGGLAEGTPTEVRVQGPEGPILAAQTSALSTPRPREVRVLAGGEIVRVAVKEGDRVEEGQVLVTLADDDLEEQINSQRIRVQQAELEVASLEEQLASTKVVSPFDGTVVDVSVAEGDEVGANTTVAVVASHDRLEVVVPVDELDISKVKIGQEAVIVTEALPGKSFRATVTEVAEEGYSQGGVGVFDVTLDLLDRGELKAGMTVEAKLRIASKQDALLVPIEAVQQRGEEYYVWLMGGAHAQAGSSTGDSRDSSHRSVRSADRKNTGLPPEARQVRVQVGLVNATTAEITEGVNEGDQVLIVYTASEQTQPRYGPAPGGPIPGGGQFFLGSRARRES